MATKKKHKRIANEAYYTDPALALAITKKVHSLIPDVEGRPLRVLEPSAGKGAFCKAAWDCWAHDGSEIHITAVEPFAPGNHGLFAQTSWRMTLEDYCANRAAYGSDPDYDLTLGNPPYNLAEEHLALVRPISTYVAFLLRLSFLGSQGRADRLFTYPGFKHLIPIAERPHFIKTKKSGDNSEYACFVWERGYTGRAFIEKPLWVEKS